MKNKKGFTLVELLAVMTLLLIITMLAYPNFAKLSTKVKNKFDYSTKLLIESAAKIYVNNNQTEIDNGLKTSSPYCLPVGKIAAYDYLDTPIKNSDGNDMDMSLCVLVSKETTNNKKKYKYELSSTKKATGDYLPPILTLKNKGNAVECKLNMYPDNINKTTFDNNCEVVVSDNKTKTFTVGNNITVDTIEYGDILILEYIAVDESGNKSKPLDIKIKK